MALYDLTPEERRQVESFLLQPPPAQFQPAVQGAIPQETLLKAQSGLLGSQGRLIQQMDFRQRQMAAQARAADVARQIQSVNPLDPERDAKIRQLAASFPEEFATSVVQQSLGLNEDQRRQALGAAQAAQKAMEEQQRLQEQAALMGGLQGAAPQDIEQFIQMNPLVAARNRSLVEPALERATLAQSELEFLPPHQRERLAGKTPSQIKLEAKKFTESLPRPLRSLAQDDREEVVSLVEQYKKAKAAELADPKAEPVSETIVTRLTGLLGTEVTPDVLDSVYEARVKVMGPANYIPESRQQELLQKLPAK